MKTLGVMGGSLLDVSPVVEATVVESAAVETEDVEMVAVKTEAVEPGRVETDCAESYVSRDAAGNGK